MSEKGVLERVITRLSVLIFALVLTAGVALIDYSLKYKTAADILYLVPIFLATWLSWRFAPIAIAILSGLSDNALTLSLRGSYDKSAALNSTVQVIFFIIYAFVLLAFKESRERLKRLSTIDSLTGLANTRHFFEVGEIELQRSLRYNHPFSVVYIDIDDFKSINDMYGHSVGDIILSDIAKRVKGTIRITDTMARLGGDEFAILLPETGEESIKGATARIQKSLLHMKVMREGPVTVSMGVVANTGRPCSFNDIVKTADAYMYEAKRNGKNGVKMGVYNEAPICGKV